MESKKLNALDLFSGAGGLSLGLKKAGINVKVSIELDKKIANTYKYNNPATCVINEDIKKISFSKDKTLIVNEESSILLGDIDLVVGGPPCQGFSSSGYRIRAKKPFLEDSRNFLYWEFYRVVKNTSPKAFVIENVPGILNHDAGETFRKIKELFSGIGYNVSAKVLNAVDFGVPQARKRAIIVGNRLGINSVKFFDNLEPVFSKVSVWEAISDLSPLESGEGIERDKYHSESQSAYQDLMRAGNHGGIVYNHISSYHKPKTIDLLKMIKPGMTMRDLPLEFQTKSRHSGAYGRMTPDMPAYTITTRLNTPSVGRITHPYSHRTITPREAARIQSFPDDYIFIGDVTSIGMQIGNSVPPLLGDAIGKSLIKSFFP